MLSRVSTALASFSQRIGPTLCLRDLFASQITRQSLGAGCSKASRMRACPLRCNTVRLSLLATY